MRWTWVVRGAGTAHLVVAELSMISSRETVLLDGEVVHDAKSMKLRNDVVFEVAGRPARLTIETLFFLLPSCTLYVAGTEVRPYPKGQPLPPQIPEHLRRQPVGAYAGARGAQGPVAEEETPTWAWVFVVACGLIPIVTLGGAIPGAIGGGGAFACYTLAHSTQVPTENRVAGCVAITVAAWMLLAVFAVLVVQAQPS